MRIISGKYRGRIIHPKNLPVRPTTDFAKTGLFNIFVNYFDFKKISALDLFCGTGNISYEFASRGAKNIVSVEKNFQCVKFIKETCRNLDIQNIGTHECDSFYFLKNCSETFDIIFADPPYEMKNLVQLHEIIFEKKLLNKNGWFIMEHSQFVDFSTLAYFSEKRNYGNVNFSFFKNNYL